MAALRELRRSGADRATVDTLSAAWRARPAQLEARGAGSDWIAYATGGIEALKDAIACQDIAD